MTITGKEKYQRYKEYDKKYKMKYRKKYNEYERNRKDRKQFGGNKTIIFERDNYSCVDCGISMAESIKKYKIPLLIHHIDGNGRRNKEPNNDINNLIILCFECHNRWHFKIGYVPKSGLTE